ncbi:DUF805 domain-containing protein [Novosphingobium sp. FGD1]|uniref:DUF805 domain-containing protein n=1 Tax=Novosphingobium silvae TaxID=2692619 RepID=A0A7X4GLB4_9SPHN|nr:DUF805 domain-containing protein [Novosphingobium silvae]
MEWIMLPLKKYADFTGRSGRREFWMFQILVTAVSFVFFISIPELYKTTNLLFAAVSGMALLGLAVPQIALQVRRFHDQDKSGWFALFNLFPYIGPVIVLIFMLIGGTRWENRYGPDPYER